MFQVSHKSDSAINPSIHQSSQPNSNHTTEGDLHQYDQYSRHNTRFEEPRHYHQDCLLVPVYYVPEVINVVLITLERTTPTGSLASEMGGKCYTDKNECLCVAERLAKTSGVPRQDLVSYIVGSFISYIYSLMGWARPEVRPDQSLF